MMMLREACLGLLVVGLAITGCDDPAAGKAPATVSSAKATAAASAAPAGAMFELKADGSKFEFTGSKVTGKHDGGFKKFTGSAKLAGDKIEGGSVNVLIDMKSVYSDDDGLTDHLQKDHFFDVENHPTAKFVSTAVKKGGEGGTHTLTGNLTMRGNTKSIAFPATIAQDGDKLSVKAEFKINRKEFGIVYNGKQDNLIRDEVVIRLDLNLAKKG